MPFRIAIHAPGIPPEFRGPENPETGDGGWSTDPNQALVYLNRYAAEAAAGALAVALEDGLVEGAEIWIEQIRDAHETAAESNRLWAAAEDAWGWERWDRINRATEHDARAKAHATAAREAIAQRRRRAADWHIARAEAHREEAARERNETSHARLRAARSASDRARRIRDARYGGRSAR